MALALHFPALPVQVPVQIQMVLLLLISSPGIWSQAATPCMMCPDGSVDLAHPDRIVPFFNLGGNNSNPTCQQVAAAAQITEDANCTLVQAQAGYCGCAGVQPQGKCSFCPDGSKPANFDMVSPSNDKCGDLFTYIEYLGEQDCKSPRFRSMQGLAYLCGCPGVEPQCSVCPDGSPPPLLNATAMPTGETCKDMLEVIEAYTADVCIDSDTTVLVTAARCGCPGSEFPVCSAQQNSHLCTHALLDTVPNEHCECYSFCDGKFSTCFDFPGGLLSAQECPGVAVSGCNRASAIGERKSASYRPTNTLSFFSSLITITLAFACDWP
jgi:hypothetical protein